MAQGISFAVSAIMSLLVPKVLGVEEFGYWQLFIFYTTYVGFFLFGLNDGVYLLHGGKRRSDIDLRSINSQLVLSAMSQVSISVLLFVSAFIFDLGTERSFVLVSTGVYLVISNLNGFLGYFFQAMNETRLYSYSCILDRFVFLLPLIILITTGISDFQDYVLAYLLGKFASFIFCLWHARDLISAGIYGFSIAASECLKSIHVGASLMFANIADMLILGVARALVDIVWGIEAFGRVSFAISLTNFFITFVTQAGMVLFPALRRGTRAELASFYRTARAALGIILPAVYLVYPLMAGVLSAWLPQYAESMRYLALLLPLCMFNSRLNLCGGTYLKVLRMERALLLLNVVTVVICTLFSIVGIFVLESMDAVLVGISLATGLRAWVAEILVTDELDVHIGTMAVEEMTLVIVFYVSVLLSGQTIGVIIYSACYFLYLNRYRSIVTSLFKKLIKLLRR